MPGSRVKITFRLCLTCELALRWAIHKSVGIFVEWTRYIDLRRATEWRQRQTALASRSSRLSWQRHRSAWRPPSCVSGWPAVTVSDDPPLLTVRTTDRSVSLRYVPITGKFYFRRSVCTLMEVSRYHGSLLFGRVTQISSVRGSDKNLRR